MRPGRSVATPRCSPLPIPGVRSSSAREEYLLLGVSGGLSPNEGTAQSSPTTHPRSCWPCRLRAGPPPNVRPMSQVDQLSSPTRHHPAKSDVAPFHIPAPMRHQAFLHAQPLGPPPLANPGIGL